jgi:hypothetical protein
VKRTFADFSIDCVSDSNSSSLFSVSCDGNPPRLCPVLVVFVVKILFVEGQGDLVRKIARVDASSSSSNEESDIISSANDGMIEELNSLSEKSKRS